MSGPVDPKIGWFLDYGELAEVVDPVIDRLDHQLLNAIPGLENPTSELLAAWLWDTLAPKLRGLCRVSVLETCRTRCDYRGPGTD